MTRIITIVFLFYFYLVQVGVKAQPARIRMDVKGTLQTSGMRNKIEANVVQLLENVNRAFESNQPEFYPVGEFIDATAASRIRDLWVHEHFKCVSPDLSEDLLIKPSEEFEIRNIPMAFSSGQEMTAVINFNETGTIIDFWFGLEQQQYKNILNYNSVVEETRKQLIVNFLENLRTAYVRRDLQFIETLYSDKALIIVGRVIKPDPGGRDADKAGLSETQVELITMNKKEYLERLGDVFSKKEDLKLFFKDVRVAMHRKYENFYGVTLIQDWISPSYSDTGILFFMIQFREEGQNPLIWVRTWQDPEYTKPEEVFGFHNFIIK